MNQGLLFAFFLPSHAALYCASVEHQAAGNAIERDPNSLVVLITDHPLGLSQTAVWSNPDELLFRELT